MVLSLQIVISPSKKQLKELNEIYAFLEKYKEENDWPRSAKSAQESLKSCTNIEMITSLKELEGVETDYKKREEVLDDKDMMSMLEKKGEKELPWIIDSGCSTHISGSKRKFISLTPLDGGSMVFGGGTKGQIIGSCQVKLNQKSVINDVNFGEESEV